MRLGIVGSRGIDKNVVFDIIGNFLHSMESEEDSIDTLVVGRDKGGADAGAREYATNFGFLYSLESVDTREDHKSGGRNSIVEKSDCLLAIWDTETRGKTWSAISAAKRSGINVVIVVPEKVRVK